LASYQFILPYYYGKKLYVKVILWLGEFAYGAGPEILNPYVALQVWAGTPAAGPLGGEQVSVAVIRTPAAGPLPHGFVTI
jgi:hypothetical protein